MGKAATVTDQRIRSVLPSAVVAALLVLPGVATPALASCAAPSVTVNETTVRPGDRIVVSGDFFAAECNDTGTFCGPRRSPPERDIHVTLEELGSFTVNVIDEVVVDANEDFTFVVTLQTPADAQPGRYQVFAGEAEPVVILVRNR